MLGSDHALQTPNALLMQLIAQEESESQWRKTKFGWMDASRWNRPQPVAAERRIELVHPLLLSALMILTCTGFLIWSSEEKDWAEIFDSCTSPEPPADSIG